MAHELKKMKEAQLASGMSEDEIAFYDALKADDVVKEYMEDETLKKIADELTDATRRNITIDWSVRKIAQARMRKIINRLIKKNKYTSEQASKAFDTVMRQAEKMCGNEVHQVLYGTIVDQDMVAEKELGYQI